MVRRNRFAIARFGAKPSMLGEMERLPLLGLDYSSF